jgi:predicted DNA-binding transcriptional regulator YafY
VTTAATLGVLGQAVRDGLAVWLGYVNAQGTASHRIVEPVSVGGGFLRGFDHQRDEMRTFALHRITSVALLDEEARA